MKTSASHTDSLSEDVEKQILDLNYRYVQALDDGRLDDWAEFFDDDGRYLIHPRNNRDMGLEGYWIYCDSKPSIKDRVLSLKEVNLYNIHYDRHLLSNVMLDGIVEGGYCVRSNYMVISTDVEGRSSIFSVGEYRDLIVLSNGVPRFKEKVVIPDTFAANTLVSTPL